MREQLQRVSGQTVQFTAVVGRPGPVTTSWRSDVTFLLEDLRFASDGSLAADHVWCRDGRWSSRLRPGDRIRFDARVVRYLKGCRGDEWPGQCCLQAESTAGGSPPIRRARFQQGPDDTLRLLQVGREVPRGHTVQELQGIEPVGHVLMQARHHELRRPPGNGGIDEPAQQHRGGVVDVFGPGQVEDHDLMAATPAPPTAPPGGALKPGPRPGPR